MRLTKEENRNRKNPLIKAHHWFGSDTFERVFKDFDYYVDTDNALFYVYDKEGTK